MRSIRSILAVVLCVGLAGPAFASGPIKEKGTVDAIDKATQQITVKVAGRDTVFSDKKVHLDKQLKVGSPVEIRVKAGHLEHIRLQKA